MDTNALTVLLQLVRVSNTARTLDRNVFSLERGVENQYNAVHTLKQRLRTNLESFDRLASSSQNAAEKLTQNSIRIIEWLNQAEDINTLFEQNSREIQNVSNFLNLILPSIRRMVEVAIKVQDILELLKLLSVSTAIEAAKHGNRGKVFSVIAKEMRTLSERTDTYIKEIQQQGQHMNGQIKDLVKILDSSMRVSSHLHQTARKFLQDSGLIKDNTQSVLTVILQYQDLVEKLMREWELSTNGLNELEDVGRIVLEEATSLRKLSEELSFTLLKEAEIVSEVRTELHEKALEEARRIAQIIDGTVMQDTQRLNHTLRSFSDKTELFELLYVMNREGVQVSSNIYASAYQLEHDEKEGYMVYRGEKPYFRIPMETQREYFSPLYVSTATKALCITVAVPLKNHQGIYGVLCADIDLNRLCSNR